MKGVLSVVSSTKSHLGTRSHLIFVLLGFFVGKVMTLAVPKE